MRRSSKSFKNKTRQQKVEQRLEQIMQRVVYFGTGYGIESMRFTRNRLENIGSGLEYIQKKRALTINYQPTDMTKAKDTSLTNNPFVEHTIKSTTKIFGKKYTLYAKAFNKLMPDNQSVSGNADLPEGIAKYTDIAFEKVANLAFGWSKLHLSDERRFNLHMMTDVQRNTVARDIANQNRALATLAGFASGKGLVGVFFDTLWLLIISLRTIYQLSAVYGKHLRGKEGIQQAYAIISTSDLAKMHEKQTLLTLLGIAQTVLNKMESEGVSHNLKQQLRDNMINTKENIDGSDVKYSNQYVQMMDDILSKFHLEIDEFVTHINLTKVKKTLPVASVMIASYYNSQLIEQIIGTAQATFAPEIKVVKKIEEYHS